MDDVLAGLFGLVDGEEVVAAVLAAVFDDEVKVFGV